MPITEVFQKCAGGCGAEVEIKKEDVELWQRHGLKWWCETCVEKVEAEKPWTPMVYIRLFASDGKSLEARSGDGRL